MSTATRDHSGNAFGGRKAAHRDGASAGPRPRAALADERARAPLRRRDLGAARPPGARRLRRPDAFPGRRSPPSARAAGRDARGQGSARVAALAAHPARRGDGHVHRAAEGVADRDARRGAGDEDDGWRDGAGAARRDPVGDRARARPDRLRSAAAPEPALHARHERVALRRRHAEPDVLARAPARDAERRGDLSLPSAFPRRRLPDLVRRRRPRLGARAPGGRRHHARRRRRRPRRDGRAQHGSRGQHPRAEHVRRGCGQARDRRADAQGAGSHAPRHGLQLLRPRRRHALRAGGRADPADPVQARRPRQASRPRSRSARSSTR